MNIMEFTVADHDELHDEDPGYEQRPAKILFFILDNGPHGLQIEELQHDGGYAQIEAEGGALDYGLLQILDPEFEKEGWYVCEGFTVHYTRGDGWTTDDDADYNCDCFRPARWSDIAHLYAKPPLLERILFFLGIDRLVPSTYWNG